MPTRIPSTEEQLQSLRADLTVVTLLLEVLYAHWLLEHPDTMPTLDEMSRILKQQMAEVTLPGVDPALADHLAQMLAESMDRVLGNIRLRVLHPEGKAHPAPPSP